MRRDAPPEHGFDSCAFCLGWLTRSSDTSNQRLKGIHTRFLNVSRIRKSANDDWKVERTFLSAHVHRTLNSKTCVRIRHDSPPSPPLEEGRRYLLNHLCLHSGRRTSPPGPLSCEERGSRTKRCVNTGRAAWREGFNTASREYLLSIMIPVYNEANTLGDVIRPGQGRTGSGRRAQRNHRCGRRLHRRNRIPF